MKYYKSIETLPIFNYFKCTEGDFRYMYKCEDVDDAPSHNVETAKAWETIQEEWSEAIDKGKASESRMKYYHVIKLKRELLFLEGCIILLAIKDDEEVIAELIKKRYNYDKNNKLVSLQVLNGEYDNLKNKIEEKKHELLNSGDEVDKYELIASIERFRGIQIDLHRTSTALFIAYLKEAKKESERNNKIDNGTRK